MNHNAVPGDRRGAVVAKSKRASADTPEAHGYESRYGTPAFEQGPGETRTESRTTTSRTLNTTRIRTTRQYSDEVLSRPRQATKEAQSAEQSPAWQPCATLTTTLLAPLASRMSIAPMAAATPANLVPSSFAEMSLEEQEQALLEDLLYVLLGLEGQYIRYHEDYDPEEERSRLGGPRFVVIPGLEPSMRDLIAPVLTTATHFAAVDNFIEKQSHAECGMVNHALCATMRKILKDYLILVAQIEHQFLTNDAFTLHILSIHLRPTSRRLAHLYFIATEVLRENSLLGNEEDLDASDDFENILESLREGKDAGLLPGRKVCKGGAILALVSKRLAVMSGDPSAREVLSTLLTECSRPYVAMLNEWLHHGNVRDPHQEFLIKEQSSIRREGLEQDYTDEYWEKRYTLRNDVVPPQLETMREKVLLAGKYLNVVRECGGVDIAKNMDSDMNVPHTIDDPRFLENINSAYSYANASLLKLLITTHGLPARLRSLKHYFFLDRSDFFSYFLELSNSELKKPARTVNVGKLQSLLEIVLRQPGSVAAEDPFKEDVRVVMSEIGLTGWLMQVVNVKGLDADGGSLTTHTPAHSTNGSDSKDIIGFDALSLDFAVPFPLSLVVSRVTLTRYQLLFRYLLSLRHLETMLVSSWQAHTKLGPWRHRSSSRQIEDWKRRVWTLRNRMLCFVQQLLYFCTSEVIEPNWTAFMTRVKQAGEPDAPAPPPQAGEIQSEFKPSHKLGGSKAKRTVDELMQDHVDLLATCLKECMLTNSKLLQTNSKIMTRCTLFADFTASLTRNLILADPDFAGKRLEDIMGGGGVGRATSASGTVEHDAAKLKKLQDHVRSFEEYFDRHLKILLDLLNYLAATETVVFSGLCARLSMAHENGGGSNGGTGPLGR